MTIDELIEGILEREGGYVNSPSDKGGPTNFGITQATLSRWLGTPASIEDVRTLTRETAISIYAHQYIVKPGFTLIPSERLKILLIDYGVHSSPPSRHPLSPTRSGGED